MKKDSNNNLEEMLSEFYPELDNKTKDNIQYFCAIGEFKIYDPKKFFKYYKKDYNLFFSETIVRLNDLTNLLYPFFEFENFIQKKSEEKKLYVDVFYKKGTKTIKYLTNLLQAVIVASKISSPENILAFGSYDSNEVKVIEIERFSDKTRQEIEMLAQFHKKPFLFQNNKSKYDYEGFV